jgi:hypothetical protein
MASSASADTTMAARCRMVRKKGCIAYFTP